MVRIVGKRDIVEVGPGDLLAEDDVHGIVANRGTYVITQPLRALEQSSKELERGGLLQGRETASSIGVEGAAEEFAILSMARTSRGECNTLVPAYPVAGEMDGTALNHVCETHNSPTIT